MNVSVIIPTYNGKHKIGNLIEALTRQTFTGFETIVIIDGSSDGTEDFLRQETFGLPLRIYTQENSGRALVRNKGAELATGNLLVFFDDDMRPEPNCLQAHINHHQHHPGSILTGAQIDDIEKATTDFQVYKCYLSRDWSKIHRKNEGKPQSSDALHITAANFSIAKEVFLQLGGFNSQLRDCEDYELALRAYDSSIPIYYSEKAFGWHDDFPTPASFIKRQLEYKSFNQVLVTNNPARNSHLLNTRLKKPKRGATLFFTFFKHPIWVMAIEKNLFSPLPRKLRYKLYSWILTAQSNYKEHL